MAKLDESTLVQMGREYPADGNAAGIVAAMREIGTLARRHQTHCENECNLADYDERKRERCEARIVAVVKASFPGTVAVFQGDPRGATVKLLPPSGATNDWGREGLCVLA